MTVADRVFGCLQGIATGDAIGKQTEMLAYQDVVRWYPDGIRGFEGAPGAVIPRYRGNRKHEWRIGETTDDTERTIAVARALIADGGVVSHVSIGREMLQCTKCVHPGVRSLWEFHQANNPARVATQHDGCGAATRVGPVGVVFRSDRLDEIVAGAREASISTHGGVLAVAAAAATAAALSSAIDGAAQRDIIARGEEAARRVSEPFADTVHRVHDDLRALPALHPGDLATRYFPDRPMTIVPLALALATVLRSAREAILIAARVGGDSDSVASIAGGILGAAYPDTIEADWAETVNRVNGFALDPIARDLAALRH
jgi:ADP-ribosylglycohydrolase